MNRSVSPPPSKRRKTSSQVIPTQSPPAQPTTTHSLVTPLSPTDKNTMRIFSWNINGIAPFLQRPITKFFPTSQKNAVNSVKRNPTIPPASLRTFLHQHGWPAVLFLQEVKIAATDVKTQDAVRKAINTRIEEELQPGPKGPIYEAHFTLPQDRHNARGLGARGKVYGVCSIVRSDVFSDFKANVRDVDWDKEGRVSVVELHTSSAKFALFNIYAVNGTENPYRDPLTGAVRGTRHDRKLAFHRLLMQECIALERDGWFVLLAGDMNVAPDMRDGYPRLRTFPQQHVVNRADFNARFLGRPRNQEDRGVGEEVFEGVDVWRRMNEEGKRYTWFPRGKEWGTSCDRVDYAIVGKELWDRGLVRGAGILDTEAWRGPSDHVPIWVDIKLTCSEKEDLEHK